MRTPDWDGRLRALDPHWSYIVKAPAGSGKTEILTARYLALLAWGGFDGGPCTPGQILAVTFTDKAATEMKGRITLWLERAVSDTYEPRNDWEREILDRARAAWHAHGGRRDLLENPTAYRVGTFHGFCASVCRAWPVESGIPVGADILPDHLQGGARRAAVVGLLQSLRKRAEGDPLRGALERRLSDLNNSLRTLSNQLAVLLKDRQGLHTLASVAGEGADAAEAAIGLCFARWVRPAREYFLSRSERWALAAAASRTAHPYSPKSPPVPLSAEVPGDSLESAPDWVRTNEVFLVGGKKRRSVTNKAWSAVASSFLKAIPDEVVASLAFFDGLDLAPEGLRPDREALRDLCLLAGAAVEHLRPLIPGSGLDYTELEFGARRALGGELPGLPSESLIFFHEKLRHILVDESQDMNPSQLELLGFLTEGWEAGQAGDERTAFIVGDPKQSIYRFRGAEVANFESLEIQGIRRGGEAPFLFRESISLSSNFRSAPEIVEFTNTLFESVMANPDPQRDEVAFGRGEAASDRVAHRPAIRLAQFTSANDAVSEVSEDDAPREVREARWVASEVARINGENPEETIGILLPRRTQLDAYVVALRDAGVSVSLVEGEKLGAKAEVLHLHNLFKALARPYDDAAWAGVLRAPWAGLGTETLFALASQESFDKTWRERIEGSTDPGVQSVVRALNGPLADFGREAYEATLLKAWEALGGPRVTAARYGTAGVANAWKFLELLTECGGLPVEETLALLEERLGEAYTPPDPSAASSKVTLMTVHRAKGLEFDHVFVAYLGYNPLLSGNRQSSPYLALDLADGAGGRVPCAVVPASARWDGKALPHLLLREIEKGRELAEVKRLLYVAATRARLSLTLSGCGKRGKEGFEPSAKASPLAIVLKALTGRECANLHILDDPLCPTTLVPRKAMAPLVAQPHPILAFDLPYLTRSPSEKLDPEEDQPQRGGEDEGHAKDDGTSAVVGTVVHRLLETLARGLSFPPPASVAAALRGAGLDSGRAGIEAPKLLAEAAAAWGDPEFVCLREGASLSPEWAIEHFRPLPRTTVMSGRIDLLIERKDSVAIVDYKAGRLPEGKFPADYRTELAAVYNPQLTAYTQMLRRHPRFTGKTVRAFLLLTHLEGGRLVPVGA